MESPRRRRSRPSDQHFFSTPANVINHAKEHSVQIRTALQQVINSWHHEYLDFFKPVAITERDIVVVQEHLSNVIAQQPDHLVEEAEQLRLEYDLLKVAWTVIQAVMDVEVMLDGEDIVSCASLVHEMVEGSDIFAKEDHKIDPAMVDLLTARIDLLRTKLSQRLGDLAVHAFSVAVTPTGKRIERSIQLRRMVPSNPFSAFIPDDTTPAQIPVIEVLNALEIAQELEPAVGNFVSALFDQLVAPLFRCDGIYDLKTTVEAETATLTLELDPQGAVVPAGDPAILSRPFEHVAAIAQFIKGQLFDVMETSGHGQFSSVSKFRGAFRTAWSARAVPLLITAVLDQIPEDRAALDAYLEVVGDELAGLESTLADCRLTSTDDFGIRLADVLTLVLPSFTRKRRAGLLRSVQAVLASREQNVVRAQSNPNIAFGPENKNSGAAATNAGPKTSGKVGVEGDMGIQFPDCLVTVQTQTLLDMLYEIIQRVSPSQQPAAQPGLVMIRDHQRDAMEVDRDPLTVIEAFDSVRDLIRLWHAMTSAQWVAASEASPRAAALIYNNSQYLVHHVLTLVQPLRAQVRSDDEKAVFRIMDLVPLLRRLGDNVLQTMITIQYEEIHHRLGRLPRLDEALDARHVESTRRLLRGIMQHFRDLEVAWKSCLPNDVYLRIMGHLFDAFYTALVARVLAMPTITKSAGNSLRFLLVECGKIDAFFHIAAATPWNSTVTSRSDTDAVPAVGAASAAGGSSTLVTRNCPQHKRLTELVSFLSLLSRDQATQAVPKFREYSGEELMQLIERRQF
ncbi:Centromere/kinetochore protein zw10 [Allomyces arbusculus]|nr:Centromere/kinetochore protein zw10 [Allomyces arbusculus]